MESPENSSSWDELARELGATPAPPVEQHEAPKPAPPVRREPRAKAAAPPKPKPAPGDWDSLAANLGIEVPPAPQPVKPVKPAAEPPRRVEREPAEAKAPVVRTPPPSPPHRRPRPPAPTPPRREQEIDEAPVRDREVPPTPKAAEPPAQRGPGVSLWHKIFGSPEQQSQKIVDSTAEPESAPQQPDEREPEGRHRDEQQREEPRGEGQRGRHRDEPRRDRHSGQRDRPERGRTDHRRGEHARVERGPERDSEPIEPPQDASTAGADDERPLSGAEGDDTRPRRPRRRRGGRGRRPEGETAGERRPPPREDRERGPKREQRRPAPAARKDDRDKDKGDFNEFDADFDSDDDLMEVSGGGDDAGDAVFDADVDADDMDSSGRAVPAGHRSIPTWDEAIGMIVDANLQTRTERRRSGPPSSLHSGPARGRPRGGRRRKKP